MQLGGERARGLEVVAERLLDDDAGVLRQPGLGEPLDDPAEQEGRDLEVEDRRLGALDRVADAVVGRGVAEVALDVGEPRGETLEHLLVELLAGADDRLARPLDELLDRPVVDRHADDRAVEQPAALQPVQRAERHHLREVAGDPEDHEHVGVFGPALLPRGCPGGQREIGLALRIGQRLGHVRRSLLIGGVEAPGSVGEAATDSPR